MSNPLANVNADFNMWQRRLGPRFEIFKQKELILRSDREMAQEAAARQDPLVTRKIAVITALDQGVTLQTAEGGISDTRAFTTLEEALSYLQRDFFAREWELHPEEQNSDNVRKEAQRASLDPSLRAGFQGTRPSPT